MVFILHLVQDDFYLETDREFFSVGSTQRLDLPRRNTRGIPAYSSIMPIAKSMKSYKKLQASGILKLWQCPRRKLRRYPSRRQRRNPLVPLQRRSLLLRLRRPNLVGLKSSTDCLNHFV